MFNNSTQKSKNHSITSRIADMFQHIFKLRYNNRHSFCFESYSQDIESFDQGTLCFFVDLWFDRNH